MRIRLTAALYLLLSALAFGESVEVRAAPLPEESSRHVQIEVTLEGKPVRDVRLDFYSSRNDSFNYSATPYFTVLTKTNGIAKSSKLPMGRCLVVATSKDGISDNLALNVSRKSNAKAFSIDLTPVVNAHRAVLKEVERLLVLAEHQPIKMRVQRFSGVVHDQSGAVISGVSIDVVRMGTQGMGHEIALKTGKDGHFATDLSDGTYIAVFSEPGFRTLCEPFEVTGDGSGQMLVVLEIGMVSQMHVVGGIQ